MIKRRRSGKPPIYDEALKIAVVHEFKTGLLGETLLARKFGLPSKQTVRHFRKWYEAHYPDQTTSPEPLSSPAVIPVQQTVGLSPDTEKANKDLSKALELAQLKIVALQTMISIASKELGVDIAKKHGAKQSDK